VNRVVLVCFCAVACSGGSAPSSAVPVTAEAPSSERLAMPTVADPARALALDTLPRAPIVVVIGPDGGLEVADALTARRRALAWLDELPFTASDDKVSTAAPAAAIAATVPLVVAHPRAPAVRVVEVCRHAGCVLAVDAGGTMAALDAGFTPALLTSRLFDEAVEIELHLDAEAIHTYVTHLDERGRIPHDAGALDRTALDGWLDRMADTAFFIDRAPMPVNVMVHATSGDAQRLVDLLTGLDAVRPTLAMSPVPAAEAPASGDFVMSPLVFGEGPDAEALQRRLVSRWSELHGCVEAALRRRAGAREDFYFVFTLDEAGRVGDLEIDGEPSEIARCMAPIVAATVLPPAPTSEPAEVRLRISVTPR
jgi:hypothetical protein